MTETTTGGATSTSPPTVVLQGVGVSRGVVVGPVARVVRRSGEPPPESVDDVDAEVARLAEAVQAVAADLEERAGRATGDVAEILSATAMMAQDPALLSQSQDFVRRHSVTAQRALWVVADQYATTLRELGGYLGERASDVGDVRDRVVAHLEGAPPPGPPAPDHPYVLVAGDLSPADTAELDPARVLALVTEGGGPTAHTAIIARSMGLPGVVACPGARALSDGDLVRVDGSAGTVTTGLPAGTPVTQPGSRGRTALGPGPHTTADGVAVSLLANVGGGAAARAAAEAGATGSGLFRTELLFLDRTRAPERHEQRDAYREVFEALPGRVVLRTLDAGADKPLPFLSLEGEPNPALGVRGLRVALQDEAVLDDQLAATVEAAEGLPCDVWVMAPMVATVDEARWFVERCRAHGIRHAGVMVEVPAAALLADAFCEVVDFLSIGTNDLTQYTLAADRESGPLASLNDPWQPATLRLVRMTAEAGTRAGKPVGVCGEAAADPELAAVLVGMGVTSLSADAGALGDVAARLASVTVDQCREAAAHAVAATSAGAAREAAARHLSS
ncbi:MAG TPA: phosphoenolpyruvate--protein phosphotransferase [Actinomycetales bacterium]|nr:phosphoenolpyruvate--protein phosphotransferase [Actinomycetales bacterium]